MFASEQAKGSVNVLVTDKDLVMLTSSIILGACYDVLIAQPFVAVSYPIFVLVLLAIVYENSRPLLIKKLDIGWFLVFPLIALAMTRFLFANEVLCLLNSIVVPALFVAHILLVTKNSRHEWFRVDFLADIFEGLIVRPLQYAAKPLSLVLTLIRHKNGIASRSVFEKVIFGVVISLPVLILVVILLSSADQVFELLVNTIISNISMLEVAKHSLLAGLVTLLAFSFIWGLNNIKIAQVPYNERAKKLDEIIVISSLGALTAVYILFSIIQFSYLFGSFSNHLPSGLTYADYARRGFFELVAVALINIGLLVGNINFTAISSSKPAIVLKGLNSVLVLSTLVMLLSAHYRMSLYEDTYGYTYLRIFTHGFMVMLFVMLGATLFKVWVTRINLAKWYVVIGLIAYVVINYVNVDTIIAQKNMERFNLTGAIDVDYMAELSNDAFPYLATLAQDSNQVIAQAAKRYIAKKQAQLSVGEAWQGYNLPEQRARETLQRITSE